MRISSQLLELFAPMSSEKEVAPFKMKECENVVKVYPVSGTGTVEISIYPCSLKITLLLLGPSKCTKYGLYARVQIRSCLVQCSKSLEICQTVIKSMVHLSRKTTWPPQTHDMFIYTSRLWHPIWPHTAVYRMHHTLNCKHIHVYTMPVYEQYSSH